MQKRDGPFAECLATNPKLVDDFFFDCLYDACALWGNPKDVQDQICDALNGLYEAYGDPDIPWSPLMCPSGRCFVLYFFFHNTCTFTRETGMMIV